VAAGWPPLPRLPALNGELAWLTDATSDECRARIGGISGVDRTLASSTQHRLNAKPCFVSLVFEGVRVLEVPGWDSRPKNKIAEWGAQRELGAGYFSESCIFGSGRTISFSGMLFYPVLRIPSCE